MNSEGISTSRQRRKKLSLDPQAIFSTLSRNIEIPDMHGRALCLQRLRIIFYFPPITFIEGTTLIRILTHFCFHNPY